MMDLAREYGGETVRLSEIEALIAQTAKTRFDILVTAVYWRINDHVAVGMPSKGLAPHGVAGPSVPHVPAPVARPPVHAPAPAPVAAPPIDPLLAPRSAPLVPPAPPARAPAKAFDPIEADEVAAFKRALDNAAAAKPPHRHRARGCPRARDRCCLRRPPVSKTRKCRAATRARPT